MKREMRRVKIFILSAVLFSFFVSISMGGTIKDYFRDRGYDFLDFFKLKIGAPYHAKAIGVHARATALAQLGVVYFEGEQIGFDRRAAGVWVEKRLEGGIGPVYYSTVENDVIHGNQFMDIESDWSYETERGIVRNDTYWDDGRHQFFSFGAEVQTGILPGIEIGFYPLEITDFLFGIFTLDPSSDDLTRLENKVVIRHKEKGGTIIHKFEKEAICKPETKGCAVKEETKMQPTEKGEVKGEKETCVKPLPTPTPSPTPACIPDKEFEKGKDKDMIPAKEAK